MSNQPTLTPEQLEAFGRELDAIRESVIEDLGQADVDYIRRVIKTQRATEVAGRALLMFPPAWPVGTALLSLSKILDNMEIGHNIMHGQYEWTGDPALSGRAFEWDTACPADQWRHSHNYVHHTHTNIVGMDRDIGYGILRMSEDQPWHPYYLGNPLYAFLLMVLFQYGVALHELESDRIRTGEISLSDKREVLQEIWRKTRRQVLKDYVVFPLLAGPFAPFVFAGNLTANLVRNVWAFSIIFCGHFPEGTAEFSVEETRDESRGQWYFRQILGSANLTGGRIFHILSGNLSHQIEHHLFPVLCRSSSPRWCARSSDCRYLDAATPQGWTTMRIGFPSACSRASIPAWMSSSGMIRLIDREMSRRPRETSRASVSMSAFS